MSRTRTIALVTFIGFVAVACGERSGAGGASSPSAPRLGRHVEQGVIVSTPDIEAAVAARFGEGAVVLIPALESVDGAT